MTPEFTYRPAEKADAPVIRALIHKVGINPMDLDWRHFTVAETGDGKFVGCGQLKPHRDGSLELASLAVEEIYRRQGVARALIEHLMAQSPRPLHLMCRPSLQPLYEKFGFRVANVAQMPPYFLRIHRIMHLLAGRSGPLVMQVG